MAEIWSCNIQKRGRWFRGVAGAALIVVAVWLWRAQGERFWSIGLCVFGVFSLFEAVRGWCLLRALGVKTPF